MQKDQVNAKHAIALQHGWVTLILGNPNLLQWALTCLSVTPVGELVLLLDWDNRWHFPAYLPGPTNPVLHLLTIRSLTTLPVEIWSQWSFSPSSLSGSFFLQDLGTQPVMVSPPFMQLLSILQTPFHIIPLQGKPDYITCPCLALSPIWEFVLHCSGSVYNFVFVCAHLINMYSCKQVDAMRMRHSLASD